MKESSIFTNCTETSYIHIKNYLLWHIFPSVGKNQSMSEWSMMVKQNNHQVYNYRCLLLNLVSEIRIVSDFIINVKKKFLTDVDRNIFNICLQMPSQWYTVSREGVKTWYRELLQMSLVFLLWWWTISLRICWILLWRYWLYPSYNSCWSYKLTYLKSLLNQMVKSLHDWACRSACCWLVSWAK